MAEYEMVREIKNLCMNNQMRDVFFEEIECENPVGYVRALLSGQNVEISSESSVGGITVHANVDGLIQKFVFTEI